MQRLKSVRTNGRLRIVQPVRRKSEQDEIADLLLSIENLKQRVQAMALMIEAGEVFKGAELETGGDLYKSVRRLEIAMIKRALELSDGSQTKAAKLLKIKITTLNSKIKRYKI
jgi:transcriptional regulator with PAS, ATPase and Fis domain